MRTLRFGIATTLALTAMIGGCVKAVGDDCETMRSCVDAGGVGNGGTSSGGVGGAAAATSGGAGGTNTGGSGGGTACGISCKAPTPLCDTSSGTCVECIASTDCADPKPACDTGTHTCVACVSSDDCGATTPLCDTDKNTCVECLTSANCTDPTKARCDAGQCKPCTGNADCTRISGKTVCETSSGACVECTGTDYSSCGVDQATSTPLICDSVKHTCTSIKEHSAGLCQSCVADAQCSAGKMCVHDTFGSPAQDVGYFCHWKKGDTINGAPADCAVSGQPYLGTRANVSSVDGTLADICSLRASTCPALIDYGNVNCAPAGSANDSLCGFDAPNDAKCEQIPSSSAYQCTMVCLGDGDCPIGSTCNKSGSPFVCTL